MRAMIKPLGQGPPLLPLLVIMHSFIAMFGMTVMLLAAAARVLAAPAQKPASVGEDLSADYSGAGGRSILNHAAPVVI
ncbi:hypothetical protein PG993_003531 [Apiospora rasikravindrae]|uniref:Uncharacterized protein n=1 Tax=Apiospora rasikravindrae TaxID=990691 RepID=A0ABR1U211_9PEZI